MSCFHIVSKISWEELHHSAGGAIPVEPVMNLMNAVCLHARHFGKLRMIDTL